MDTHLLRAFVMLAGTGNYHEASSQLFITQPALTKKIKSLESELGVTLFVRGRHGAQLTHAGRLLLEKARDLVEQAEAFRHYALNVAKGTTGNLAIGFGISGIKLAPALVARFRNAYPDVVVSLEDISSAQQASLLLSGQLQLAFMRLPVEPPLTGRELFCESLVLAVKDPALLPVQLVEQAEYKLLDSQPLIQLLPEKGPGLYRQIERFLDFNRVVPNIVQQAKDIQTVLALVAAGMGIASCLKAPSMSLPKALSSSRWMAPMPVGESAWFGIPPWRTRCGISSWGWPMKRFRPGYKNAVQAFLAGLRPITL